MSQDVLIDDCGAYSFTTPVSNPNCTAMCGSPPPPIPPGLTIINSYVQLVEGCQWQYVNEYSDGSYDWFTIPPASYAQYGINPASVTAYLQNQGYTAAEISNCLATDFPSTPPPSSPPSSPVPIPTPGPTKLPPVSVTIPQPTPGPGPTPTPSSNNTVLIVGGLAVLGLFGILAVAESKSQAVQRS